MITKSSYFLQNTGIQLEINEDLDNHSDNFLKRMAFNENLCFTSKYYTNQFSHSSACANLNTFNEDKIMKDNNDIEETDLKNLGFSKSTDNCIHNETLNNNDSSNIDSKFFRRKDNDSKNFQSQFNDLNFQQSYHKNDSEFEKTNFMSQNMHSPAAELFKNLIIDSMYQRFNTSSNENCTKLSYNCKNCNFRSPGYCCCNETGTQNNETGDAHTSQVKPQDNVETDLFLNNTSGFESVLDTEEIFFYDNDLNETSKDSDCLNFLKKSESNKLSSVKSNKKFNKIKSYKRRNLFERNNVDLNDENGVLLRQKPRRSKEKKIFNVNAANEYLKWLAGEMMCFVWIVIVLTIKCIVILLIIMAFYIMDIAALIWLHLRRLLLSERVSALIIHIINFKIYLTTKFYNKRKKTVDSGHLAMPTSGEAAIQRLLSCKEKNPYSILGVTISSTDEEIKKVYRKHAILVHPDKCQLPGAEEAFKILNNAFEMIGEPENRKLFDSQSTEVKEQEAAMQEFTDLLAKLKTKIEDEMNLMFCTNCNKCHKRILMDRDINSARYCKKCSSYHPAKNTDLWAETSMMGFLWHYYACMDGKIYDVTEWASCQIEDFKLMQANSHNVLYHISTKGNRSHIKQEIGVEAVMQKLFNMSAEIPKDQESKSGFSQNSSNINKKKQRKKKH